MRVSNHKMLDNGADHRAAEWPVYTKTYRNISTFSRATRPAPFSKMVARKK